MLVMDRGERDLTDVIAHSNIAGRDENRVKAIAKNMCDALKFLNEDCDIMHGDVKPRNFLSINAGQVIRSNAWAKFEISCCCKMETHTSCAFYVFFTC